MHIRKITVSGMSCDLFLPAGYEKSADRYPVIYINGEIPVRQVLTEAAAAGVRTDFILLAVAPGDWNDDFTPWPGPAIRKGEMPPEGRAGEYIAKLTGEIKPYMDANYRTMPEQEHTAVIGYSLGGLTALYSLYLTDNFGMVGSISGSLWYDSFCAFMEKSKPMNPEVRVYLSLGRKEKMSRNPWMAGVEKCTEEARRILLSQLAPATGEEDILEKNNGSLPVYYEWNDGGHFHQIEKRFAKAIVWWRILEGETI